MAPRPDPATLDERARRALADAVAERLHTTGFPLDAIARQSTPPHQFRELLAQNRHNRGTPTATQPFTTAAATPERRAPSKMEAEREREIEAGTHDPDHDRNPVYHASYDSLTSDWAGRKILAHYLSGHGARWDIADDPRWSDYMRANNRLRRILEQHLNVVIGNAALRPGTGVKWSVTASVHGELENGEAMTGYQYLHGSNENVGDVTIEGWVMRLPGPRAADTGQGGSYVRVRYLMIYTWHDIVRPKSDMYRSDYLKDLFAQAISFKTAAPPPAWT